MRKAFYYDRAIPPEKWLRITSLLWDNIWLSPLVASLISSAVRFDEVRNSFFAKLYDADRTIFDLSPLNANKELAQKILQGNALDQYKQTIIEYTDEIAKRDIEPASLTHDLMKLKKARFHMTTGGTAVAQKLLKELDTKASSYQKQMIEKADYFNRAFYNSKFKELYPQLDYFFDKEQSFHEFYTSEKEIILLSVEAFLPVCVDDIVISQIKDFRQMTGTQRLRFRKNSEEVLSDFMRFSSESEFAASLNRFEGILSEELDVLKKTYRSCKIEACQKGMGIFTVSSALSFLASVASLGIFIPASITASLSFASARAMANFEKDRAELTKSPWGYLMSLKDLK